MPWIVHKFGGSSVADAACFARVAAIVTGAAAQNPRTAVVLSACRGVTDALLSLVAAAEAQDPSRPAMLEELRSRHQGIAEALISGPALAELSQRLDRDLADVRAILDTVARVRSAADDIRDLVAGFGELWSTEIFTALLRVTRNGSPQTLAATVTKVDGAWFIANVETMPHAQDFQW